MVEKYFMESKSLFFLPGSNGSNKPLKDFNLQFDQFGYSTGYYGKNTTWTFGNLGNGGFDQSRSSVAPKAVCQTSLFIPYHPLIVYLPVDPMAMLISCLVCYLIPELERQFLSSWKFCDFGMVSLGDPNSMANRDLQIKGLKRSGSLESPGKMNQLLMMKFV